MLALPFVILLLSWNRSLVAGTVDNSSETAIRAKTMTLVKPSFVPYCTTRDICKPVCDCAMYEDCELLEMNPDVRNKILIALNQARSVQTKGEPQAAGMPQLGYSDELEEISKCWAARCDGQYSECFRTPVYKETTQTVGVLPLDLKLSELPLDYWDRTIQMWLGEVRKTTAEVVSSLPAGKQGDEVHDYAQILADASTKVGCAWSRLVPAAGAEQQPSVIFVCTFAPRGPRQGEPIYKTGKACSACEDGYACDFKQPFEFLCKENGQSNRREGERKIDLKRTKDDSGVSQEPQIPRRDSRQPQYRAASASLLIPSGYLAMIVLLCLFKFIK